MSTIFIAFILPLYLSLLVEYGESLSPPDIGRRDAISKAAAAAVTSAAISLKPSNAVSSFVSSTMTTSSGSIGVEAQALSNPPPILSLPIKSPLIPTSTTLGIPRVGYSFYKTDPGMAERCAALSLRSGITHLDLATQYKSNAAIGKTIRTYLRYGRSKLALGEQPKLLELMDASYDYQASRMPYEGEKQTSARRREGLFLSHKLSNEEQSTDPNKIRSAVLKTMDTLGVEYLDMVSIHSPLTNSETRLATYRALVDLQQEYGRSKSFSIIRSIGVCNYGLRPLKEIAAAGLPLPAVNQLELSPFNTHREITAWCSKNGVAVSCAAWSRLSGVYGPSKQWGVVSEIAKKKGITKAQVLVRWSLQKGFICVPRSGSGSEIERVAIAENSYGGVAVIKEGKKVLTDTRAEEYEPAILTPKELAILDGLDVRYKAGRLGRTDGWDDSDITGVDWDPTEAI